MFMRTSKYDIVREISISDNMEKRNGDCRDALEVILGNLNFIISNVGYETANIYLSDVIEDLKNLQKNLTVAKDHSGASSYDWYWIGTITWGYNIATVNSRIRSINDRLVDFIERYEGDDALNRLSALLYSLEIGHNKEEDEYI